jgi:hypothetical protein
MTDPARRDDENRPEGAAGEGGQKPEPGLEPPQEPSVNQVRHEPFPASHHDSPGGAEADQNEEADTASAAGRSPAEGGQA